MATECCDRSPKSPMSCWSDSSGNCASTIARRRDTTSLGDLRRDFRIDGSEPEEQENDWL